MSNFFKDTILNSRFVVHRGANNNAPNSQLPHLPENTMPALIEAFNKGALYVECDIHLTRDRKIVVIHDDTLARTARYSANLATTLSKIDFDTILNKQITELSYEKELSQVDVGSYADYLDKKYSDTKIPLLEEFLSTLKDHPERHIVIEIKAGDEAIIPALQQLLNLAKQQIKFADSQILIICFDYPLIKQSKSLMPEYQHLWLTISTPDLDEIKEDPQHPGKTTGLYFRIKDKKDLEKAIALAKEAKMSGLDLEYDSQLIDADFINRIHNNGLLAIVWTYPKDDTLAFAKEMLQLGVDLINTNQPEFLFKNLNIE